MDKIFPQILESDLSIGFIALIFGYFIFGFIQYYRAEGIENKINVSSKVPPILVSIGHRYLGQNKTVGSSRDFQQCVSLKKVQNIRIFS